MIFADNSNIEIEHMYDCSGYGLERGGVTCMIYNSMATNTTVIFLETVPWFLRVYFSSLKVENNGKKIEPCKCTSDSVD